MLLLEELDCNVAAHLLIYQVYLFKVDENFSHYPILRRNYTRRELKKRASKEESTSVMDGLLVVGGENGKRVTSEAYKCLGLLKCF